MTNMLTITQVAERYNASVPWVRGAVKSCNFPQPIKFSQKMHRWEVQTLDKFDEKKRKASINYIPFVKEEYR